MWHLSLLEASLFENAVQRTRSEVITRLACDRHPTWLPGMFELSMATSRCHKKPAIVLKHAKDIRDFHHASVSLPSRRGPLGDGALRSETPQGALQFDASAGRVQVAFEHDLQFVLD